MHRRPTRQLLEVIAVVGKRPADILKLNWQVLESVMFKRRIRNVLLLEVCVNLFSLYEMASALDVSNAMVNWARDTSGRSLMSEANNVCECTRSLHWLSALVSDEQVIPVKHVYKDVQNQAFQGRTQENISSNQFAEITSSG
jgi:hypothetical protein